MTESVTNRKIKGDMARALLRMELKSASEGPIDEAAFKAEWTLRRDEMLDKAQLVRMSLSRMGYDLTPRVEVAD